MNRTWIFNCNPNQYDLPKMLADGTHGPGTVESWRARLRKAEMSPGDRVYHWVSGPAAGLYAVSRLVGPVREDPEDGGAVVDINFERVLVPPVLRAAVAAVPDLSNLTILAVPGHTRHINYPLNPSQAVALDRLCGMPEQWPFDPGRPGQGPAPRSLAG